MANFYSKETRIVENASLCTIITAFTRLNNFSCIWKIMNVVPSTLAALSFFESWVHRIIRLRIFHAFEKYCMWCHLCFYEPNSADLLRILRNNFSCIWKIMNLVPSILDALSFFESSLVHKILSLRILKNSQHTMK